MFFTLPRKRGKHSLKLDLIHESISLEAKITKQRIYSLKTSIYSGDRKIKPRKIFINNVYMLLGEIQGRKLELTKVKELTKVIQI